MNYTYERNQQNLPNIFNELHIIIPSLQLWDTAPMIRPGCHEKLGIGVETTRQNSRQ